MAVGALCGIAGYFYGMHVESQSYKLEIKTAAIEAYKEVRPKELKAAESVNSIAKENENEKKQTAASGVALSNDFVGMRYRSNCPALPTIAASSGQPERSTGSEWTATGETDFDGIAREIAELGRDYDDAVAQIKALTAIAESYRKACSVD